MLHSLSKIWLHVIWGTKERAPLITKEKEKEIHSLLVRLFKESGCPVRIINGMEDHIHCLFLCPVDKLVVDVIKQVKGSSSHYINQNGLAHTKFGWNRGYAVYSVCHSNMDKLVNYIINQKHHHMKRSFQNEFDEFIRLNEIELPVKV